MDEEAPRWHRRFAAELFNHTWDLIEKPGRSAEDDAEMVAAAFASRFHWGKVDGADQELIVGDWQIANACSRAGLADAALRYAEQALAAVRAGSYPEFMLASCLEGVARAHAAAGNDAERDRYIGLAKEALAAIADEEDRAEIARQLATVPGYV